MTMSATPNQSCGWNSLRANKVDRNSVGQTAGVVPKWSCAKKNPEKDFCQNLIPHVLTVVNKLLLAYNLNNISNKSLINDIKSFWPRKNIPLTRLKLQSVFRKVMFLQVKNVFHIKNVFFKKDLVKRGTEIGTCITSHFYKDILSG